MKLRWAAGALALTAITAGCSPADEPAADAQAADAAIEASAEAPEAAAAAPASPLSAARPAAPGAPSFAVIYPGGAPQGDAVTAQSPAGPGGIVTYTTDASPDAVVAFHKGRAEAAGLTSINAMNQGEARGYSAGDGAAGRGQLLSVVATPVDGGPTSVQLSWSAGR